MKKLIFMLLICFPAMVSAQWNNDPTINTKIADTIGMQVQPIIVVNDYDESYISWFSEMGGYQFDVYMQRLDKNGNKLWDNEGLLISNHPTMTWTTDYGLALDKQNNAILLTQDLRTGSSNVYAYSISPSGEFLWGNDGIALTNDNSFNPSPKVLVDQEGNIVSMWENEPADTTKNLTISFQKLSPNGDLLWNNVLIENDTAHCWMSNMINTEDTCTIVVWIETLVNDTSGIIGNWGFMHSFAQKIDAAGNLLWQEPAVIDIVENMSLQPFFPSLASDGNGGLYVSWAAMGTVYSHTCYVQHVNAEGVVQWTPNGVNVSDSLQFERLNPHVVSMQENGMVVFWDEVRQRSDTDWENAVMGQNISLDGDRQWTTQGKLVDNWYNELETSVYLYDAKAIEEDFVLFFDHEYVEVIEPDTIITTDLYITRIDTDANPVWVNGKTAFSNHPSWKLDLVVSDLSNNQWIAMWEDNRNDPENEFQTGIYTQNISVDGKIGPLSITALPNANNFDIVISPNPAKNFVKIDYKLSSSGLVKIEIVDLNGRIIKQYNEGNKSRGKYSKQLHVSDLNEGMYIVRIRFDNSSARCKLIKN